MTNESKLIIDYLGCDYEFFETVMDRGKHNPELRQKIDENDAKIFARHSELHEQGKKEGFIPVIIEPDTELVALIDHGFVDAYHKIVKDKVADTIASKTAARNGIIEQAKNIDGKALLDKWFAQLIEDYEDDGDVFTLGDFVEPKNRMQWSLLNNEPEVIIAKIPTKNPWELAAWLPAYGLDTFLEIAEQVAALHYWYDVYGVETYCVSATGHLLTVAKPPLTNEEAETWAKELYLFWRSNYDSVRELASYLKGIDVWCV